MGQPEDPLSIAFALSDQQKEIVQLLVVGLRLDGSFFSYDSGITVDEAKKLLLGYLSWIDISLGREIERASKKDKDGS